MRDLQSFFYLTPSVLVGRSKISYRGVGFVGNGNIFSKKLFIVFVFNNVSGSVEGITLRLCLVLLVVVILA